ncbi:MAG: ion transporter [Sedimentisphaerales bacterium]|nr:ion transporter [Sedimentisphaerales bacterium]
MNGSAEKNVKRPWRDVFFEVIFEADTAAGKWFDIILILCIVLSVAVVMLDSVASAHSRYGLLLKAAEWFFTIIFTIEYILRLWCVRLPMRYARSFFGIVDLLAVLPTYISILAPSGRYLTVIRVIRVLRVLRIFRVLGLGAHAKEAALLREALYASRRKIQVFLLVVLTLVVIIGSLMYAIEGGENGFTSIPVSVYWAVVTLTTVGYGDISPTTAVGQFLAAIVMVLGYSIIVVPTGLVTVELSKAHGRKDGARVCSNCSSEGHDPDAEFCKYCGCKI